MSELGLVVTITPEWLATLAHLLVVCALLSALCTKQSQGTFHGYMPLHIGQPMSVYDYNIISTTSCSPRHFTVYRRTTVVDQARHKVTATESVSISHRPLVLALAIN